MAKYIEREPVILAVNMAADKFPYAKDPEKPETYSKYNEGWTDACDYIMGMIEAENCADVAPVVHGKYLKTTKWWQGGSLWKLCSVCKTLNYKSNYCPNCGARMDGDKHEID